MTPATRPCELITPFGGRLVDLVAGDEDERPSLLERAKRLPRVPLSLRAQYDLEMLAVGAFSPLDRFMGRDDYESVLDEMRLHDGTVFPIPLAVPVREDALRGAAPREVALTDERGTVLALLEVEADLPVRQPARDAGRAGRDRLGPPPGRRVRRLADALPRRPSARARPASSSLPRSAVSHAGRDARAPRGTREPRVVAFQTRNPMHRIHEELTKRAARAVGGTLLIHPAVGVTRPQDVHHALRVEAYEVLVRDYYDPATTLLSLMPLAMRFAGPREAVWHALIRRNYGASHLIVGRDHAGPGPDSHGVPFYGPYDAQVMAEHYSAEIGVQTVASRSWSTWRTKTATRKPPTSRPVRASSRSPARRCARTTWPRARSCPHGSPGRRWRRSCRGRTGAATAPPPECECAA